MSKNCQRCGAEKQDQDFQIRRALTGERQPWCRDCAAAYKRDWYVLNRERHIAHVKASRQDLTARNRERAYGFLARHPCVDCGETELVVLEFDHVSGKKYRNVGYMISGGFKWETIEKEIAKCAVRCVNCHRRKTAREQGVDEYKRSFRTDAASPGS